MTLDGPKVTGLGPGERAGLARTLAGISHTFLRNMTDRGEIPVQYRGAHRRIRRDDILSWLAAQQSG